MSVTYTTVRRYRDEGGIWLVERLDGQGGGLHPGLCRRRPGGRLRYPVTEAELRDLTPTEELVVTPEPPGVYPQPAFGPGSRLW